MNGDLLDPLGNRTIRGAGSMPPLRKVAKAARELYTTSDVPGTLHQALLLAVEFMPGADDAGVSLRYKDGQIETPAATSERGAQVDRLQYEAGDGPCFAALLDAELVSIPNLESEERWGCWGPRTARETGVRSMLCFRLFTNTEVLGALNLYSSRVRAFTREDVEYGHAFAAQVAVHVARSRDAENFETALVSRARTGEALGILMERYGLSSERAFEVLLRLSQHTNRKLRDVAAELVETRQLPQDPIGGKA